MTELLLLQKCKINNFNIKKLLITWIFIFQKESVQKVKTELVKVTDCNKINKECLFTPNFHRWKWYSFYNRSLSVLNWKFKFELSNFLDSPFFISNISCLRACLNFARVSFECFFRGYFSVFTRRIASYLTSDNGKKDRKKTQKWPDNIFFIGKFRQTLKINANRPPQQRQ